MMKNIKLIGLFIVLLMTSSTVCSQTREELRKSGAAMGVFPDFNEIMERNASKRQKEPLINIGVSAELHTTYVTKNMLDFAKGTMIGAMSIDDLKGKLEVVEIYTTREGGMDPDGLRFIASGAAVEKKLELALNLTLPEKGENVAFYTRSLPDDDQKIVDMVMIHTTITLNDEDEPKCTVVRIRGEFTANDFMKMIGK